MKKKITILSTLSILMVTLLASDHVDSPSVTQQSSDIADFYAFQGNDNNNLTFIVTTQGILSPTVSETATFDQNVITQINIDTNNDNVEDLVIQAICRGGNMWFFGPVEPSSTGDTVSVVQNAEIKDTVAVTPYKETQIIKTAPNGIKYFAGVTDDPFFFDIATFRKIKAGEASGFNNPGNDTWNGLNVLSIAVEIPKSLLGNVEKINTWATTHRKQ